MPDPSKREHWLDPSLAVMAWFTAILVIAIALLLAFPPKARGGELALGDSLALGFGQASRMPTRAIVGEPSCPNKRRPGILSMVPAEHFGFVLLSAGTNDVPGRCIEAIRAKINADKVQWVVPVNGARNHVLAVASAHGDATLFYTPGVRSWPHPATYFDAHGGHKRKVHRRVHRHGRKA